MKMRLRKQTRDKYRNLSEEEKNKRRAYRIHFWYMSKDAAIRVMNNSNLVDKKGFL